MIDDIMAGFFLEKTAEEEKFKETKKPKKPDKDHPKDQRPVERSKALDTEQAKNIRHLREQGAYAIPGSTSVIAGKPKVPIWKGKMAKGLGGLAALGIGTSLLAPGLIPGLLGGKDKEKKFPGEKFAGEAASTLGTADPAKLESYKSGGSARNLAELPSSQRRKILKEHPEAMAYDVG